MKSGCNILNESSRATSYDYIININQKVDNF